MKPSRGTSRRAMLQALSSAAGAPALLNAAAAPAEPASLIAAGRQVEYPRRFTGEHLKLIAFPLGGVGAGAVSLGGRGQFRDWEMFNRPDKGHAPSHGYACLWVKTPGKEPFASILESRILPPYEGSSGLGSGNAPGMIRLESATFTGEYPLATIDFKDSRLPVDVQLRAFSPFIPLDLDESGLPVAILRYGVRNRGSQPAEVSLGFALENMLGSGAAAKKKANEVRESAQARGLIYRNPGLEATDPLQGSMAVAVVGNEGKFSALRGWPNERWWASPLLFWDDFSADGELGPEPADRNSNGAIALKQTIAPGAEKTFTFVLAWHFPNRTPARCGWSAPKGRENELIGNWYATKFGDAWAAVDYAASNLPRLEASTMEFVQAMRDSTLPAAVKDAATANLSTLASTTCFRTADGEFHGFEGVDDKSGCCHGNCTHVWNYEVATDYLFPAIARSYRNASFHECLDDNGAIHFRQMLPKGSGRSGFAAADGQMGQLIKAYLDWKLSKDDAWLRDLWPRIRRSVEFCWMPGGWDANRDGVMEGAQHNTYDVEFFGPNPQCGIYYLAGLRAAARMARTCGDDAFASTCDDLAAKGAAWIDSNLFNGDFYVQQIRGMARSAIGPAMMSDMGSSDTENPSFQVGEGCLLDQLMGQYLADLAGLGDVLDPAKIRKATRALWTHNLRRSLANHESFQRTYVLNDEPALIVCDYAKDKRPRVPFPYYSESWTGLEYMAASLMMHHGMVREGVEVYGFARARYDGVRRNPWDEPECGHHYARALSSWSGFHALAGVNYDGGSGHVKLSALWNGPKFVSLFAAGSAWGMVRRSAGSHTLEVKAGVLTVRSVALPSAASTTARVLVNGKQVEAKVAKGALELSAEAVLRKGDRLEVRV